MRASLTWRGTVLTETKTKVTKDFDLMIQKVFAPCSILLLVDHQCMRSHKCFILGFFAFAHHFTESKEAGSVVVDGENKPASPSTSPPTHCTPPSLELPGGPVVDNTQLSNSHPAKASTTPSEGITHSIYCREAYLLCIYSSDLPCRVKSQE